jgi:hypothetical protein
VIDHTSTNGSIVLQQQNVTALQQQTADVMLHSALSDYEMNKKVR